MLLGEYTHTLDDKHRLTLPAKFKSEVGTQLTVTRGFEDSLFIYSQDEWRIFAEKIARLPMSDAASRGFSRFFLSGAHEVTLDKAGRLVLPEGLRNFADIGKQVVVVGVQTRIEVWDVEKWEKYKAHIEEDADALAEKLGEIGIF